MEFVSAIVANTAPTPINVSTAMPVAHQEEEGGTSAGHNCDRLNGFGEKMADQ
jgi:hypothetical protein